MGRFLTAFGLFLLAHVIPAAPVLRRRLSATIGATGFTIVYSLMSIALFTLLISEALRAPYVPLWPSPAWMHLVPLVLLPLAAVLFGAALLAPNPFSISFVGTDYDPQRPGAVAFTRHPLLWALGLWGLAHVPPNGDVVALILFGGLGAFAFVGMAVVEARKKRTLGPDRWRQLTAGTSLWPLAAILRGRARWPMDLRTVTGGIAGLAVAFVLLAGLHLWLFGRSPLGGLIVLSSV